MTMPAKIQIWPYQRQLVRDYGTLRKSAVTFFD